MVMKAAEHPYHFAETLSQRCNLAVQYERLREERLNLGLFQLLLGP
jgi:hypothetical protein